MHTNRSDVVAYLSSGLLCILRYGIIVESASYEACTLMHAYSCDFLQPPASLVVMIVPVVGRDMVCDW